MSLVSVRSRVDIREIVTALIAFALIVALLPGLWAAVSITTAALSVVGGLAVGAAALGLRARSS